MKNISLESYINSPNPKESSLFPFLVQRASYKEAYPRKPGFRVMHWHDDLQFTMVKNETLTVVSPGKKLTLAKGQGIFINRKIPHQFLAEPGCEYINFIFPAHFLKFYTGSPAESYIDSFVENAANDFIVLDGAEAWHREIFRLLYALELVENERENSGSRQAAIDFSAYAYKVLLLLCQIWSVLRQNHKTQDIPLHDDKARQMTAMLRFIETHYAEPVTLEQLAKAGNLSKSGCLRYFRNYLQISPYRYLLNYRLAKAEAMLRETGMAISLIAVNTGFHQFSYFSSEFKKQFNVSPKIYRMNFRTK